MLVVFAFGGATLFCELIAEMRQLSVVILAPTTESIMANRRTEWAFGKASSASSCSFTSATWSTACSAMPYKDNISLTRLTRACRYIPGKSLATLSNLSPASLMAACHGNISIKVSYNVGHDIFRFPILESSKGKLIGIIFAPLYWIVALVLAASIPQITSFQSFVGDACALPFTSTFPPFLVVGFKRQREAILPENKFDPATGRVTHVDSGLKRWIRGSKIELI
jgi:hypothetical protein